MLVAICVWLLFLVMDHRLRHCSLTLMNLQTVDLYRSGCWALVVSTDVVINVMYMYLVDVAAFYYE